MACGTRDGQRLGLATFDEVQGRAQGNQAQTDLTAGHCRRGRRATFVRHMQQLDARFGRQQFGQHMTGGARACGGIGQRPRLGTRRAEQISQRVIRAVGWHHDQHRVLDHDGNRRKVAHRVVGQLGIDGGIHDELTIGGHQECVAIGRRLGCGLDADDAAGTGPVLHHHLLPQHL